MKLIVSDFLNYRASDPMYIDLHVYIKQEEDNPQGAEWMFTVTYDHETKTVYDMDPQYAENAEDGYDETDLAVPTEIAAKFQEVRPAMVTELHRLAALKPVVVNA